ncbi:putative aldo-keto reductase 1 [Glycine max]|nr:putative aldo-keto reductase 1 [Glycine max]
MEALTVKLSEKDPREISEAVPTGDVAGGRYYNGLDHFSWNCDRSISPSKSMWIVVFIGK